MDENFNFDNLKDIVELNSMPNVIETPTNFRPDLWRFGRVCQVLKSEGRDAVELSQGMVRRYEDMAFVAINKEQVVYTGRDRNRHVTFSELIGWVRIF